MSNDAMDGSKPLQGLPNEEEAAEGPKGDFAPAAVPDPESKRGDARKGHLQRIGGKGKDSSTDLLEDAYLAEHKQEKAKEPATLALLKAGVKQDRVCALLEDAEVDTIIETMEYFEFEEEEPVIEQGKVGTTFFVVETGKLQVSVNGTACNIVTAGSAFGGLALLYRCPRTATVVALEKCGVWGANGRTFQRVLQENAQRHYTENRKFLDSIRLFDGLTHKQKDRVGEGFFTEVFEANARVVTRGEDHSAIYFVKKGELATYKGGEVMTNGQFNNGEELGRVGPGDCFGERALVSAERHTESVIAKGRCELLCISVLELKEVLGSDLTACLERNFVLQGLKKSPIISQFSSSQQHEMLKSVIIKSMTEGETLQEPVRFLIVIEGSIAGSNKDTQAQRVLTRGEWYEDSAGVDGDGVKQQAEKPKELLTEFSAAPGGTRLGLLTKQGLADALKALGLSAIGCAEEASDYARKMVLVKKVHIFRHLSEEQVGKLVKAFVLQMYRKGAHVIKQGEVGSSFFVIANGEVSVMINGNKVRTMANNAYFGERALLFDEPRTATVEVSSNEAELWSIEKSTFSQIVKGMMQQELMHRIRLQDVNVSMKDVQHVKVIGSGAAGVVRLVQHKKTATRYALKRVLKMNGKIPEEVKRECDLLKETDHPFIMKVVKTYETVKSVYILTELITGGELHSAIRTIPTVLSRAQAQFYAGSLVIVLEELSDRSIVYRDLKPENVMLDAQGYLKLIDFGIAKKLEEGKSRTYTMIGTPHYMAPEVMRGHGYGTEVDMWSLGIMLFEFVCGFLPFADELDDPTEVCTAVLRDPLSFPSRYKDIHGRNLMQALLCRQPKKRLGAGLNGYEDVRNADFFKAGHADYSLFSKIMGRELDPPVVPQGENYCSPGEAEVALSDAEELG